MDFIGVVLLSISIAAALTAALCWIDGKIKMAIFFGFIALMLKQ
jgi:hypothetical protein